MPDSDEYVSKDDLFVRRDESGELLPTSIEAGKFGTVEVVPMTYGKAERLFGGVGGEQDVDASLIADILNEHYVRPSFDLSADDIRDMKPFAPQALLMAVMDASGLDADVSVTDGEAEVSLQGN